MENTTDTPKKLNDTEILNQIAQFVSQRPVADETAKTIYEFLRHQMTLRAQEDKTEE